MKAWHQLDLGMLISSKKCDHSEINRTICVQTCVNVCVCLSFTCATLSHFMWKLAIACFFSSSLQYSITRMPFIPFTFNNIVSTNGIGQSEYVLSVLICGFHSQSYNFFPFRLFTEYSSSFYLYDYDSFSSSSSKSKVRFEHDKIVTSFVPISMDFVWIYICQTSTLRKLCSRE